MDKVTIEDNIREHWEDKLNQQFATIIAMGFLLVICIAWIIQVEKRETNELEKKDIIIKAQQEDIKGLEIRIKNQYDMIQDKNTIIKYQEHLIRK